LTTGGKLSTSTCLECGAKCCRYIATEIDTPTSKRDFDNVRWFLLHRGVHVFRDHDDAWYLEFDAECEALGADGLCHKYDARPRICRKHGHDDGHCEHMSDEDPHAVRFSCVDEFEAWMDDNGIKWRRRKKE
jgi:Fe-S-cluster containining protein